MLDNPVYSRPHRDPERGMSDPDVKWSLQEIRIVFRKYGRTILTITGVILLLAILYVATATRQYTAVARLLIDTPRSPLTALEGGGGGAGGGSGGLNIPEVESSLQVLVSERLGLAVLRSMTSKGAALAEEPKASIIENIIIGTLTLPRRLLALFNPTPEGYDPERLALEKLMAGLSVRRVGSSYVLEIAYTSTNPQVAADTANAFANTYVQDEVETKAQIWRRASVWLQDRVNELRQRSEEAARAAQDFKAQNGNNADTWPKARELDRTAEAYDALYSAFLRRYTDSVQQQTFPITQARVITEAYKPQAPSQPRVIVILALASVLGLGVGSAVAFTRWSLDRAIRSPAQIARYGYRCLTTLPQLPRVIARDAFQVMRTVSRAPRSQFAENLRLVRAEIGIAERQKPMRLIGITSALPGEGKSTVASNLAQLFASAGPTLLIDADTRNPQITRTLGSPQFVSDDRLSSFEPTTIPGMNLDLISIGEEPGKGSSTWFEQGGFEALLDEVGSQYSRVIVDLPPAGVVAEARFVAPLLDAIIVVVEWESTPAEDFISCIDACDGDTRKVFGVILNKAHRNVLPSSKGSSYSNDYFQQDSVAPVDLRKGRLRG